MELSKYALVVVGSGPAGLGAAKGFRAAGGTGPVLMVTEDEHLPYDRPPLSKEFLRGESEAEALPLQDEDFYRQQSIEVVLGRRVGAMDTEARTVTVSGPDERIGFDACVLALGAQPTPLSVDGGDHPDLFFLRSRVDGERLRTAAGSAKSAVIIGSGFIGCEAAASLATRGLDVTIVSSEPKPQAKRLGDDAADRLAGWLTDAGVTLVGGAHVTSIIDGHRVVLDDGTEHTADLVLVAAGVIPDVELAAAAGLNTHEGRIAVDAHLRTSADGIFAAGDAVYAQNAAAGRHLVVEHWGDAERMGQVAGTAAAAKNDQWAQVPGFWSDIGAHGLQYAAWGDGYDEARFVAHSDDDFTVWYGRDGVTVGVLTAGADEDYERGQQLIENGDPLPS